LLFLATGVFPLVLITTTTTTTITIIIIIIKIIKIIKILTVIITEILFIELSSMKKPLREFTQVT